MIVLELNKYSKMGGEVDLLCADGNVYSMLVIMLCLALDHEETELHCFKAANGYLQLCLVTALKTSSLAGQGDKEHLSLWRLSFRNRGGRHRAS